MANISKLTLAGAWAGLLLSSPTSAQMPEGQPFSMRGVELGITIDAFRATTIPNDDDRHVGMQSACSNDGTKLGGRVYISAENRADGIVECQWFSTEAGMPATALWEHWIKIGRGSGIPTFHFINGGGALRLFQITFYANNSYHADILDALTRGYGPPKDTVEPFKTKAGGDFTSLTSVWDNGLSTITLIERCGHLERYCLTYDHSELIKPYRQLKDQRANKAALNI